MREKYHLIGLISAVGPSRKRSWNKALDLFYENDKSNFEGLFQVRFGHWPLA